MPATLLTPVRIRGAGGAGKLLGPSEAPDTLQSDSIASVLILLSEGPCAGLANGLQDVYFSFSGRASDAVPVQNADGSYNFNGVIAVFTPGLPDQDPLPGFPAVQTTVTDGAQIFHSTPLVREITDPNADAVIVTIEVPALYSADPTSGNVTASSVGIEIDVQSSGGSYTTALSTSISGKCSSAYQKSYRIPLTGSPPWNVKVSRTSADPVSVNTQNYTYLSAYTIVEDFSLIYPDSCLLGLTVDARLFGNQIPTVLCKLQGLTWQIPANYDPVARTYATTGPGTTGGVWDGSFVTAWTNNPAWIFYGLVTNARFGLGQFVDATLIDKFSLYAIGLYCDGLVPDGTGTGSAEPRYLFNGVIASQADAIKALQVIASNFRGMVFWGSLGVMVSADMPADPVKLVVPGNAIQGEITYSGTGQKAIHTYCFVTWCNPDLNYEQDLIVVETPNLDDIARYGYRPISLTAAGCTSRGQAYRMGLWLLYVERQEAETASWTASWDEADLAPGDYISIADPAYAGARFGGRLLGTTVAAGVVTAVQIDAPITLESGQSYTFTVMLPDGTIGELAITTGAGSASELALATPLTQVPVSGAVWVICSTEVEPRQFTCIVNKENSKHLFEITALLHDPGLYALIEQDITLEPAIFTLLPSGGLPPPTGLTVLQGTTAVSGVSTQNVLTILSWTAPGDPRISQYEAQIQIGGVWQPSDFTTGQSFDYQNLVQATYAFRVRSQGAGVGSTTLTSAWAELDGVAVDPATVYVAPGAVTATSLDAGLSDFITSTFGAIQNNVASTAATIASAAQEQDAENWLKEYNAAAALFNSSTAIQSNVDAVQGNVDAVQGNVNTLTTNTEESLAAADADIATNATAIAGVAGAQSSFETTVTADFGTTNANVTTNATAISDLNGALSSYETTVAAEFGTTNANVTTNANAISDLNGALSSYETTVVADFGTTNANVTTNATAISDLNGAFSSYETTVAAEFGTTNANVTTNANAISTLNGAFSAYEVTVSADFATTNANVTTNANAISTLNGAFSAYEVTVSADFATTNANVTTNANAISTLNGAFSAYEVTVSADFATTNANVTTNANAISTLNGAFSSYETMVTADFGATNANVVTNATAISDVSGTLSSYQTSVTAQISGEWLDCSFSIASPCVVACTAHGLVAGNLVEFLRCQFRRNADGAVCRRLVLRHQRRADRQRL